MPSAEIDVTLGLSAELLQKVSPAELPLLDALGPELVTERPRASDGALGFGEAELSWVMAGVPVATVVGSLLLDAAKSAATDVLKEWSTEKLRQLRNRDTKSAPQPAAATELIDTAGRRAFEHALLLGLSEERAALLADAVRGALMPASTTHP